MLGVELPFFVKLKSLLAPGSCAVKGLIVIKSLLISTQPVLLNEAICFPQPLTVKHRPFLHTSEQKGRGLCFAAVLEVCQGTSPNSFRS